MTPEELIQETKESIEFNTKKIEIVDKDIEQIKLYIDSTLLSALINFSNFSKPP